jgi:hypothetical protein
MQDSYAAYPECTVPLVGRRMTPVASMSRGGEDAGCGAGDQHPMRGAPQALGQGFGPTRGPSWHRGRDHPGHAVLRRNDSPGVAPPPLPCPGAVTPVAIETRSGGETGHRRIGHPALLAAGSSSVRGLGRPRLANKIRSSTPAPGPWLGWRGGVRLLRASWPTRARCLHASGQSPGHPGVLPVGSLVAPCPGGACGEWPSRCRAARPAPGSARPPWPAPDLSTHCFIVCRCIDS